MNQEFNNQDNQTQTRNRFIFSDDLNSSNFNSE